VGDPSIWNHGFKETKLALVLGKIPIEIYNVSMAVGGATFALAMENISTKPQNVLMAYTLTEYLQSISMLRSRLQSMLVYLRHLTLP